MRSVALLAYSGTQSLDIVGPMEVFAEASFFAERMGINRNQTYELLCLAPIGGEVTLSNGLRIAAVDYRTVEPCFDTLVIPGGEEQAMRELGADASFMSWLHSAATDSRRVVSVCTGAFIVAALGVLEGRQVCTHWSACKQLEAFAPGLIVDPESLFRKDERFYSSAGVTAGIDLSLALIEEDMGSAVAAAIARNLVLYLRRPGGQSQFSQPSLNQQVSSARLRLVIDYINSNLDAALDVGELADVAAMSPRSFARLFQKELNTTPAAFVRERRLSIASQMLGEGDAGLKQIAAALGFSSAAVFANAFKRRFGLSPDVYRARFGSSLGPA